MDAEQVSFKMRGHDLNHSFWRDRFQIILKFIDDYQLQCGFVYSNVEATLQLLLQVGFGFLIKS